MVMVNGEQEYGVVGQTITEFLTQRSAPIENIVVEQNGNIVHRADFDTTKISENDKLELISFVGGG
ncbi:sulfur carrier protein ThiS [Lentilactobacillus otakiensis]|uniref:Thiamine biosynthesis protein ThiS n=1 Tax=Lentilactobacillus otakiensis DSM 19908 = JCM 15040 TaxID=1423780 RepID=S4NSN1_9LACO|nr:sulfur carrier protein ThiS [Lentilactobacillus otakiensis]MBZ3776956.1 sulfur carrier protein ThiS [Lentilactobacillus otakiensis]MDV3517876.1 sulfur carrier protein ThiS [Lentilactobacillus otakiensis]GAD16988.1 thiamine biosynthesis protein ThiS [Lentilactobacillus otakiensis DSM 19908 = JCM 15040]